MIKVAKILVTGANGFVGRALCRRLIKLGHQVYGLDCNDPLVEGFVSFYCQDITKAFEIKENFDFVFHLAAHNVTYVGNPEANLYHRVNVVGTQNVLKAVKTDHFVFLSTTKVYLAEGKLIDEDSPILPLQEYEKSKLAAEEVCRKSLDPANLLIFRCANIVGQGQPQKAVIPVLFKKALATETMEIFVPRGLVLQFLFLEDLLNALVKVVEKENLSGVYNLAGDEHIRLDQLAQMIKEICHSTSAIDFTDESVPAFSPISSFKAEKALGWTAKTTIKEILASYQ